MSGEVVKVCALDELGSCEVRQVVAGPHKIAVVRIDDDVYAIGDTCSHQNVSLSEGEVLCEDKMLECWKHGSAFSLEDGTPHALPATKPVPVYEARLVDGHIEVVLP